MGGEVVHARRGDRAHYRPIRSALCAGSDAEDAAAALLALHPFATLYVADLDALQGGPPQWTVIDRLRSRFPGLELWIDAGVRDLAQLREARQRGTVVLAAESMADGDATSVSSLQSPDAMRDAVLSLDFRDGRFLGPAALLQDPARWPARVIAMELARVGSDAGPDLALIRRLRSAAPHARVFAAGGIRDTDDLASCRASGACGALVASSLHDGRIGAGELRRLASAPASGVSAQFV